ncbi:MAG TPA: dihydrofolate reductase family protein [Novosphingobium sp.]|nr:dihydrofolate reductase family protein [Novosphingobium sp.]
MARRIIGAAFVSLDGVMQAPGAAEEDRSGGFALGGWLAPVGDESLGGQIDSLFAGEFDLLLGRRTYDIFAAYWPFMPLTDPIAASFARARKYVVTGSRVPLDWAGSELLSDIDAVAAVRAGDGPDLIIQGSSTLYPQLLERGLIDRLVVMTAPVLLGTGKRLWGDGTPPVTLRMIEQRSGAKGMRIATYEPAGPVETAAAGPDLVTAPELARRARVAEGTW